MKITGSYTVPGTQADSWQRLQDPAVLARCIPGCDRLEKVGDDEYKLQMRMLIASLSGSFDGKVRILDQKPPTSFRLRLNGSGKIGFVNAEGLLELHANSSQTEVRYDGDVQVGGTIAGIGQRLLDGTSKLLIKKFFENFSSVFAETAQTALRSD